MTLVPSADVEALQEVAVMLQHENSRLRQVLQQTTADHNTHLQTVTQQLHLAEATSAKLTVDVEHLRTEKQRLERELEEAVRERKRQAGSLNDVRRQVDGRLSRLMEELRGREEEVHRLQYANRELERDNARLSALESRASTKDQALDLLRKELDAAQATIVELTRRSVDPVQPNASATVGAATNTPAADSAAVLLLPLYRKWTQEVESSLFLLEDNVEKVTDEAIDTLCALQSNGGLNMLHHDRRRQAATRQLERDRLLAQSAHASSGSGSLDKAAVLVQSIRVGCDNSKYTLKKVATSVSQLSDLLQAVRQAEATTSAKTSFSHSTATSSPAPRHESPALLPQGASMLVDALQSAKLQLETALATRDQQLSECNTRLTDLQLMLSKSQSECARLEGELSRRGVELESLRSARTTSEQDAERYRTESADLRTTLSKEREAHSNKLHEMDQHHQSSLRATVQRLEERIADLTLERDRHKENTLTETTRVKRELEESQQREQRLKAVLEESRDKRIAVKRQKDAIQEELSEQRSAFAVQSRELREASSLVESLTEELSRTRSALEAEVSMRDEIALGLGSAVTAAAVGDQSSIFRDWKREHHQRTAAHSHSPSTSTRVRLVPRR